MIDEKVIGTFEPEAKNLRIKPEPEIDLASAVENLAADINRIAAGQHDPLKPENIWDTLCRISAQRAAMIRDGKDILRKDIFSTPPRPCRWCGNVTLNEFCCPEHEVAYDAGEAKTVVMNATIIDREPETNERDDY